MKNFSFIKSSSWDSKVYGLDAYELLSVSPEILEKITDVPGHYTIKVDPLMPKKILHDHDFYYCDTLIEPYCFQNKFVYFHNEDVSISHDINVNELLNICDAAFEYGRFSRDFNLNKKHSDQRYNNWLKQLCEEKTVFSLIYQQRLAGFIGYANNKLILHALSEKYRGQNLAKYFWSKVCKELFDKGHKELITSVSAANLAVMNLYASLGFKFRNAVDIYHRLIK